MDKNELAELLHQHLKLNIEFGQPPSLKVELLFDDDVIDSQDVLLRDLWSEMDIYRK